MTSRNTELPNPADSPGFALHHASFAFKAALKDAFRTEGLVITPEEFVFLAGIPDEGAPQSVLAKKTLKDKTTVTRLLDRLVSKAWVTRQENPESRREQIIQLTAGGRQIKAEAIAAAGQLTDKALAGLSTEEVSVAKSVLHRIVSNLTD